MGNPIENYATALAKLKKNLTDLLKSISDTHEELRQGIVPAEANNGVVDIPEAYNVPYFTGTMLGDKKVMGCRVWCGTLPNNTEKMVALPEVIKNDNDITNVWVDVSNSYSRNPTTGESFPVTSTADGLSISLVNKDIRITTTTDGWLGFEDTVVSVKFIEPEVLSD